MAAVFDIDGVGGRFAMYDEPPSGPSDAPLTNPLAHLDRIKIHSSLAYLQVAAEVDVPISHPYVARPGSAWSWSTWSFDWYPAVYQWDHLLFTHNLGYVPFCLVTVTGGAAVEPGIPVQATAQGGTRFLTVYATATQIRAIERVDTGNGDIPAININYKVLVLRQPASLGNGVLFDATSGRVTAGQGWFDSDYHYLRAVAAGESPFFLVGSQNIDTRGGVTRMIDPLGGISHDFYQTHGNDGSRPYYTGTLSSVTSISVQR